MLSCFLSLVGFAQYFNSSHAPWGPQTVEHAEGSEGHGESEAARIRGIVACP